MPVLTRSSSNKVVQDTHNFANSIVNNIVDKAVTIINHRSAAAVGQDAAAAAAGVSASIGLGCCSICLEDIQFEKGRFVLECGHAFHSKCILTSFQHGNRCPNCRTEVKESIAHEQSYMMPTSLRVYSSIIHDAADHFIHDLGNITFANVVHRMLLMSSESQDLRSIQYPYIKRLLVQFASVFIQGVAFSVRDNADGGREIQDPVPIDIVDNMMADIDGGGGGGSGGGGSGGDPDYDAAISNPALDAAVAYQAIVTTDMNFDSPSTDNVGSALIRRSMALAAMGSQRADLALRRATALSRRRQQMQEVHRLLQRAQEEQEQEQEQEQVNASSNENQNSQQQQQNINMVISENQNQNSALNEEEEVEEPNPWGVEF
jgi:hypothetical protein